MKSKRSYEALRFTSSAIIFLGWVVMIVGWVIAFAVGAIFFSTVYQTLIDLGASQNTASIISNSLTAVIGLASTLNGVFTIATGQMILVFLDIRDNTYATVQSL